MPGSALRQRLDDLIVRYRDGEPVEEELYSLGYRFSKAICLHRGWSMPGGDRDDLIQEGAIGFMEAVRDWRPDGGSSFSTFAGMCIVRQMIAAMRSANYLKRRVLTYAVRLERPIRRPKGQIVYLRDLLPAPDGDPVQHVVALEDMREEEVLVAGALQGLSNLEREAVLRITRGQSYAEAARALGTTPKAIDNALQRARRKLLRRREAMSA